MESVDLTPGVLASGTLDACLKLEDDPSGGLRQSPAQVESPIEISLAEENRLLKIRIVELERQAAADNSFRPSRGHGPGLERVCQTAPIEEETDHQGWDSRLYQNPKDWESRRRYHDAAGNRYGPWADNWYSRDEREYHRPDVLDPSIGYENRRLRLRQSFEWKMDRLYLTEEAENRRQQRVPTPKEECVMDILIGEPIVHDGLPYHYGDSVRGARQSKGAKSQRVSALSPVERPLPERIRIHSTLLLSIMARILGPDADALADMEGGSVVFLRPFRALVHCEQSLRDWCRAVEESLPITSSPERVPTEGSARSTRDKDNSTEEPIPEGGTKNEREEDEDAMIKSPTALKHLKCALEFIDTEVLPRIPHALNSPCRKVLFSDLWHLFRPGTEVIGSDGKQAYRNKAPLSVTCVYIDFDGKSLGPVSRVFDIQPFKGPRDVTALEIYPLELYPPKRADYTDTEWKNIETLSPADRSEWYRQRLITRGRRFLAVTGTKHMFYAGPSLNMGAKVESQVIVDFEAAFAVEGPEQQAWKPSLEAFIGASPAIEDDDDYHESCQASCCRNDLVHDDTYVDQKERFDFINSLLPKTQNGEDQPSMIILPRSLRELRSSAQEAVSPDELLIMSYRVIGFVMRSRIWAQLDLTYLSDVYSHTSLPEGDQGITHDRDQDGTGTVFDRLVLDKKHKHMIESFVAQHFRDKKSITDHSDQVDIVRGKGEGLIMLLHGAPGAGRTSTVEGIAELFRKPLFQITCGDIGTTPKEVEKALETTFTLASRWDCILLLDEADVFLAQRTKEDFQRNALVAVFLRAMDYYAGVLFLTTNRVGDFDEAFTSRIHVCLYYPELSHEMTVAVFELNLNLIEERFRLKGQAINIERMQIASFASQHYAQHPDARWNGRQIRNACQNALALAGFEAQGNDRHRVLKPDAVVTLSAKHFETLRDGHVEFTKYMNKLYGTNSARRAHEDRLRALLQNPEDRNPGPVSPSLTQRAAFARAAQPPADVPVGGYASSLHRSAPHTIPSLQRPYYQSVARVPPGVHATRYSDRELNPAPLPEVTQGASPSAQSFPDDRTWANQQMPTMYNDGSPQGYLHPRPSAPGRAELPTRSGGAGQTMPPSQWQDVSDGRH
ncbi:hypothetical protein BO94DRAFT_622279 [Aspergillus sclerotioniger CBS 115572]|uniref:AAA+ ATPase domain-containing protein n=1 Tax=Aspergillus sclerotioniger CBS 115572 TaxID=1450535 RepID=A0A317X3F9_9EURO|nr:hypothetical protein BO94DRAFT_622279 [Aspergillus sclerotioniger CBS 115572]PWY93096.1 hypothetical protein BO94DRAFT_622279 [Aspergillus sclerotioniger CBS 115572]